MKRKGFPFPSYENMGSGVRRVKDYRGRPPGIDKQMRYLRVVCKDIIDSKDPRITKIGAQVIQLVLDEPKPEFSALHLFAAGIRMSKDTGESWSDCMAVILEKFEARAKEHEQDAEAEAARPTGSVIRRLLRAIVPRRFRARDEEAPRDDQHESADQQDRAEGQA